MDTEKDFIIRNKTELHMKPKTKRHPTPLKEKRKRKKSSLIFLKTLAVDYCHLLRLAELNTSLEIWGTQWEPNSLIMVH